MNQTRRSWLLRVASGVAVGAVVGPFGLGCGPKGGDAGTEGQPAPDDVKAKMQEGMKGMPKAEGTEGDEGSENSMKEKMMKGAG